MAKIDFDEALLVRRGNRLFVADAKATGVSNHFSGRNSRLPRWRHGAVNNLVV